MRPPSSHPDFSPESRVWVYTASRALSVQEADFAQKQLDAFCRQWTAHNQALQASAEVYQGQWLILMVDETRAGASGCSIDKSVHFLEDLGQAMGIDFFERMRFAWVDQQGQIQMADRAAFAALVQEGSIGTDTLVVNTLVQTKRELEEKWLLPFGESWHRRLV
jgi:hypothetical protein